MQIREGDERKRGTREMKGRRGRSRMIPWMTGLKPELYDRKNNTEVVLIIILLLHTRIQMGILNNANSVPG